MKNKADDTNALRAGKAARPLCVQEATTRLRSEFPLQLRIEGASSELQAAYVQILRAWISRGEATSRTSFPPDIVPQLIALDAIADSSAGLGCYPFSAVDSGIDVRFAQAAVHAMCAIDALAIPMLVGASTTIKGPCDGCARPLSVTVSRELLRWVPAPQEPCFVHYRHHKAAPEDQCCVGLCKNIVFLCTSCAKPHTDQVLTLEEAMMVGQQFFAFQKQLLTIYPPQ